MCKRRVKALMACLTRHQEVKASSDSQLLQAICCDSIASSVQLTAFKSYFKYELDFWTLLLTSLRRVFCLHKA